MFYKPNHKHKKIVYAKNSQWCKEVKSHIILRTKLKDKCMPAKLYVMEIPFNYLTGRSLMRIMGNRVKSLNEETYEHKPSADERV